MPQHHEQKIDVYGDGWGEALMLHILQGCDRVVEIPAASLHRNREQPLALAEPHLMTIMAAKDFSF